MAAMQGRKSRMMRRGSLLRDPTRMMMDAGDDEGAGDCFIDGADRILHVVKWKANGDEDDFAKPMEKLWETFEGDAPGWKWVVVGRDGPSWLAVMLFGNDESCVAYSEGVLAKAPALSKGHVVYDDAVPIRKKVAKKDVPPGSFLWCYCVEVDKKGALTDFEEQLIHKLDKSILGFAITKPFQGGKRISLAAIASKETLNAYRSAVLNPLLKTIPVSTIPYDDVAMICGYNDTEPDDGDCVIA